MTELLEFMTVFLKHDSVIVSHHFGYRPIERKAASLNLKYSALCLDVYDVLIVGLLSGRLRLRLEEENETPSVRWHAFCN